MVWPRLRASVVPRPARRPRATAVRAAHADLPALHNSPTRSSKEPTMSAPSHTGPSAIAERTAQVSWQGSLAAGQGRIQSGSGALDGQEVTWVARTEQPDGKTSPEELCAAAHASCFSMALALILGQHGTPPDQLQVIATVALADVDGTPT